MTFLSSTPLVSVIVPAFNAALYLREALDSVRAQTYAHTEILVVDDNSSDETATIATEKGDVQLLTVPHGGVGAARNAGVAAARGELLTFLDADDLWTLDKMERQLKLLREVPPSPAPCVVYGHAREFFSPDLEEQERPRITLQSAARPGHLASALLIGRADFERIGPFGSMLGECIDWHLRALEAGATIHVVPEVVLWRRIHARNTSRLQRDQKSDYVRLLKASLDRRRGRI